MNNKWYDFYMKRIIENYYFDNIWPAISTILGVEETNTLFGKNFHCVASQLIAISWGLTE